MTHLQALAMLLTCSVLSACGNRGDLYLVPSEATEADLENVDEVLDELEGNLDELPVDDGLEVMDGAEVDRVATDEPGADESATVPAAEDNNEDDDRQKRQTP